MNNELLRLQNGSDIRGIAMGEGTALTPEAVERIADGFALWLKKRTGKSRPRVGVGHDSRLTAKELSGRAVKGLFSGGAAVSDCGLSSTPAMFMGTVFPETDFDGAVVLTASHLPREYNGMKFFTKSGGLEKEDIREVLTLAGDIAPTNGESPAPAPCALMELYAGALRDKITRFADMGDTPLKGLHIVVDAGNGTGGFFVRDVLEPLGAECSGSQFLDPDGDFPNHIPNPENSAAMAAIQAAVLSSKADLGVIFDTDADRMSAVLADGREVNRDAIIAMMAAILAEDYPGGTIVTDSVTSDRLTEFLGSMGLKHRRFKRGYRNVINEAIRLNSEGVLSPLAIETSGHGAMKENYFLDDGAYMAVKLVAAAAKMRKDGKTVNSLIDKLPEAAEERECRIPISGEDYAEYGAEVLRVFKSRVEERGIPLADTCEGVRVSWYNGWSLLRQSLHEPRVILNAESMESGGVDKQLALCRELLSDFDRLDLGVMK